MISKVTDRFFTADHTLLCADYYAAAPPAAVGAGAAEKARSAHDPGERVPVVILHGYCEHRGRYQAVAERLAALGHPVIVGDLRGHGESSGPRAFVRHFADYLMDVTALLDHTEARLRGPGGEPAQRPVLLGHSMGGLVAARFLLQGHEAQARISALALSSPFFGLKIQVPAWKRGLGRLASVLYPRLSLPSDLRPEQLSHDGAVVAAYGTDPLVSRIATARWFTEAMAAQQEVQQRASAIQVPVLLMHGGDDSIADPAISRAVFDHLGTKDKVLTLYPGLFHEIFNETERGQVLTDLSAWLQLRSPPAA